jgi:hypothetical protein
MDLCAVSWQYADDTEAWLHKLCARHSKNKYNFSLY